MIDIERLKRANKKLRIKGLPKTKARLADIETAIKMIQDNPKEAFLLQYIGQKNYASFGDQSVECQYGMGPTYGDVVFSIGRVEHNNTDVPGDDEIYMLLVARDNPQGFGLVAETSSQYWSARSRDIRGFIDFILKTEENQKEIENIINKSNEPEI